MYSVFNKTRVIRREDDVYRVMQQYGKHNTTWEEIAVTHPVEHSAY
jgi:hypothetical protein